MKFGDFPEEGKGMLQDDMTFSLDYQQGNEKDGDGSMWASASPAPGDWLFGDEGT